MKVADRKKAMATISHLRLIVSENSRNLPPLNQSYYHAQYLMYGQVRFFMAIFKTKYYAANFLQISQQPRNILYFAPKCQI